MNKQEFEKQAEALYTDIRSFLDNAFELFYQIEKPQKAVVPKLVAEWLKEHLNDFFINIESDGILRSCFIICHSAYGEPQGDGEYCDQSGGYSEDDFHGVYYYPIGENLYFAYNYEC